MSEWVGSMEVEDRMTHRLPRQRPRRGRARPHHGGLKLAGRSSRGQHPVSAGGYGAQPSPEAPGPQVAAHMSDPPALGGCQETSVPIEFPYTGVIKIA